MLTVERIAPLPMAGSAAAMISARSATQSLSPLIEIAPPSPRARIGLADGGRLGGPRIEARPARDEREERRTRPPSRRVHDHGGEAAGTAIGFAAQRIAQEVLARGLTFERFAHAAAAYHAVGHAGASAPPPALTLLV